ncbi:hypothetical protein [Desulfosarcina sp.]|uniref:hypothetical protein n=1 Tax=Desulfosarcina sp. TaxID=2027861 RepID=UPI0029A670C3|nr:hypothetical protein [Desulfosarcina sp.]MDX2451237.1 hypothetical protein [Desulfosarcina sp.]MDX2489067.1 hypothetical protein [Desulfosarcina sp.]
MGSFFPIDVASVDVAPNYNVAPTQEILAIAVSKQVNSVKNNRPENIKPVDT